MIDLPPITAGVTTRARKASRQVSRRMTFCLAAILTVSGVVIHAQAPREWPTYPIKTAPAELRPAIQHGELIILSIQNAVLSELSRELGEGGPAGAFQVCHIAATSLIYRLEREGVAAGRTSARLRTQSNAPRAWAAPVVARYATGPAAGVDGFVVDLGSRIGMMRPVTHRAICAPCHGLEEQLDPAVRAELKSRYRGDLAIGFKEGDLRGWLWVELPKKP
jgi:hypothetical protein